MVFYLRFMADIKIFSFKEKGLVIANILGNNFPGDASTCAKKSAKNVVALIRANESWLKRTIEVRDDFNHYTDGKMHPNKFIVVAVTRPEGVTNVVRPEMDGHPVKAIMDLIVNNILAFVECFVGMCLCPGVTRVAVIHMWSGEMNDTQFAFVPWHEIDRVLAEGAKADGILNERK